MKRNCFLFFLLLVVWTGASGQSTKLKNPDEEQTLLRLEQHWMNAMKVRDEGTLNRLVGPEFSLAGANELGRPAVPRATWMDNTFHHLKVESFSFDQTKVQVFGDAAIVRSVFTWKGTFDGEHFIDTSLLIDTWLKRRGKWQVVSRLIGDYKKPESAK